MARRSPTSLVMSGGFLYMSAAGSPHQMDGGPAAIVNALVGFTAVILTGVTTGMVQRRDRRIRNDPGCSRPSVVRRVTWHAFVSLRAVRLACDSGLCGCTAPVTDQEP